MIIKEVNYKYDRIRKVKRLKNEELRELEAEQQTAPSYSDLKIAPGVQGVREAGTSVMHIANSSRSDQVYVVKHDSMPLDYATVQKLTPVDPVADDIAQYSQEDVKYIQEME